VNWPGDAGTSAAYRAWSDGQLMAALHFRYPSKGQPDKLASYLSKAMHRAGPLDILSPPDRSVWQPRAIHALLQRLTPANMLLLVSSKALPEASLTAVEPIYGSKYAMERLDDGVMTALTQSPLSLLAAPLPAPDLHLPPKNVFLPTDFSLVRHGGYAAALGLADIDAVAASQPAGGAGAGAGAGGASTKHAARQHVDAQGDAQGEGAAVAVAGAGGVAGESVELSSSSERALARFAEVRGDASIDADATVGGSTTVTSDAQRAAAPDPASAGGAGGEAAVDSAAPRSSDDAAAVAARLRAMILPIDDMQAALGLVPPQASGTVTRDTASQLAAAGEGAPVTLWWMPDAFFGRPRTYVVLELAMPTAAVSARHHVLTALYVAAVRNALQEASYAAARGGTSYSVAPLSFASGLSFSAEGYTQVLPRVLDAMLPALANATVLAPRVTSDLKLMVAGLRNARKDQPYRRALYYLELLTKSRRFTAEQLLTAAADVGGVQLPASGVAGFYDPTSSFTVANPTALAQAVAAHAVALWSDLASVNLFVYGNENTTTARGLAGRVLGRLFEAPALAPFLRQFPSRAGQVGSPTAQRGGLPAAAFVRAASLPTGQRATLLMQGENADDVNSAAVSMYQVGLRDSCAAEASDALLRGRSVAAPATAAQAIALAKSRGVAGKAARRGTAVVGGLGGKAKGARAAASSGAQAPKPQQAVRQGQQSPARPAPAVLLELARGADGGSGSDSAGARRSHTAAGTSRSHTASAAGSRQGRGGVLAPSAASADEARAATLTAGQQPQQQAPELAAGVAHAAVVRKLGGPASARSGAKTQDALAAEFRRRRAVRKAVFEAWEEGASLDSGGVAAVSVAASGSFSLASSLSSSGADSLLGVDASAAAAGASPARSGRSRAARRMYMVNETQLAQAGADLDGDCDLRGAAFDMLSQLLRDPAFDELRTKQQLGYIVFATGKTSDTLLPEAAQRARQVTALSFPSFDATAAAAAAPVSAARAAAAAESVQLEASTATHGRYIESAVTVGAVERTAIGDTMQSLVLLVQGSEQPANVMDDAIAAFTYHFESFLRGMDVATWLAAVNGVRTVARRLPVSMSEAFMWEWEELGRRSFRSSRRVDEARALRRVGLEHVIALYRRLLLPEAGARIATVDVFGKGKTVASPTGAAAPSLLLSSIP
jgi:hypothetical protein